MRVSTRRSRRWAPAFAAAICVAVVLAGCAPSIPKTTPQAHHVTVGHAIYPHFPAYRNVRVVADQIYERPHGRAMLLDVCLPTEDADTARPAILAIHGGGWTHGSKTESDFRNVCEWLASAGYVTASIDYRLAPKYVYPDALHDADHAVEWLRAPAQVRRFAIDPAKIGILGSSAGGNLAALVGTQGSGSQTTGHRVAAVVDLSGPIDLTTKGDAGPDLTPAIDAYLGCASLEICPHAREASPNTHVDSSDPPFFIANSTNELVPLHQAENFVTTLRAANVNAHFVVVGGTAHAVKMLHASLRDQIIQFLGSTLGNPQEPVSDVARS
jgi:acetyl esterase